MKTEKWYQRRLAKYFTEYYEQYEDTVEFFNDPAPNQWLFDIPELGVRVELTCDRKGDIHEEKYELNIDRLYLLLKRACDGMDAVYEDYIIKVIGINGFNLLREKKFLLTCGSINGRNLYTLE
jgi:hypothetical protein